MEPNLGLAKESSPISVLECLIYNFTSCIDEHFLGMNVVHSFPSETYNFILSVQWFTVIEHVYILVRFHVIFYLQPFQHTINLPRSRFSADARITTENLICFITAININFVKI